MAARIQRLPAPTTDDNLRRFTRAHSPLQPPRFRWPHGVLLVGLLLLLTGQQRAPGIMGDISAIVLGDWQVGIVVRVTVIMLMAYAALLVRGFHWLSYVALMFGTLGLGFRLGEVRITHEPLTLGLGLSAMALAVFAVRLITRQPEPEREEVVG